MTTDFLILSGFTVPKDYFWDAGNPFETSRTNVIADSQTEYISGYAPGLKVIFRPDIKNLIYEGIPNVSSTYVWNFGDYYNSINNEAVLPCQETIEHTYILPGKYNVTLINIQSKQNQPLDTADDKCFGKHDIGWFWSNLESALGPGGIDKTNKTTWNETMCVPPATASKIRTKWWDEEGQCFQKFCKIWNWQDLSTIGKNPIFWFQTYRYGDFYKRWKYEVNETVCNVQEVAKATVDTVEQITLKPAIVEVVEIMPVAAIYSSTYPLTGYSPYNLRLSPIHTKTGSFPIDRIDWNPGDGSSIKTITRYTQPDSRYFTYNGSYFNDPLDPRNYDFVYTLTRNIDTYPIFYPSLTCYSACTNSTDSCSIVVGPILLEPQTQNIQVLKAKNTTKGDIYGIEINKNITFLTTVTGTDTAKTVVPTQPTAPIRQITGNVPISYFGNTGEDYPDPFTPSCEYTPSEPVRFYLSDESDGSTAITLENEFLIFLNR